MSQCNHPTTLVQITPVLSAGLNPTKAEAPPSCASTPPALSTTGTSASDTHYSRLSPQPVEIIEAWDLGFHAGSALKYIARYRHKGSPARDLRKAAWFLRRLADLVEGKAGAPEPQV